ncbi:unnamed protein product [Alopecurus aequalis]
MAALKGKRCLGLDGDWSLMLDELTNGCSLVSLANSSPSAPTVIALPPLPDTPPPYLRFGCALSSQSPPNCTLLLGLVREKSLLHCRPGDAEWSRLPVEFDEWDEFDGPITPGHNGKVYATTMASLVAVDASTPTPVVERTGFRRPPPCPVQAGYKCYPIPCPDGELFLVRSCFFGGHPELVDVKLFHWNQEDNAWEIVESIGDRTFFVGRFSFVVPSVAEAGIQPNCVHVLQEVCGEYGIYTVSLDDMTIRLSIVEGFDQDEEDTFWALPTSFGLEAPQATDSNDLPTELVLHFTKNGWVILSTGPSRGFDDHMFFLVNPFKNYPDGDVIALPPLNVLDLKGISFSSVPGSPDFLVLAARAMPNGKVVTIQTWRIGDEDWMEECLGNDDVTFIMASHSPVFLDGVFYFLGINGRLGVVDPNEEEMEWNVLEKPDQPIRGSDEVHTIEEKDYSYLVEWKRELFTILRECGDDGSIRIFKLDRSTMVWTDLEGMEDAALFWDRSNNGLIARPPPGEDLCNKVYLPNYTETDDGGRAHAFYCLKEREYYPSVNAKEPLNAIWFQPNLEDYVLRDVCRPSVS